MGETLSKCVAECVTDVLAQYASRPVPIGAIGVSILCQNISKCMPGCSQEPGWSKGPATPMTTPTRARRGFAEINSAEAILCQSISKCMSASSPEPGWSKGPATPISTPTRARRDVDETIGAAKLQAVKRGQDERAKLEAQIAEEARAAAQKAEEAQIAEEARAVARRAEAEQAATRLQAVRRGQTARATSSPLKAKSPTGPDIRVRSQEVVRSAEQPHATYLISVTSERGLKWETERRWNDLKTLEASLQRTDGETLRQHADSLPPFHAHGKLFVDKFDPAFLSERAEQMQALLNGWARVLKVRLDAPATGPADLLAFLSEGRSGEASTMSGIDEEHLIERVIAARAKLGVTTKNAELLTHLESDFEGLTMSEVKKAASKATKRTAAAGR
jgi:hypothetical protein